MTITKARCDAARTILANSSVWDASTMKIIDGMVTARRDANKEYNNTEEQFRTFGAKDARYNVASLDEMVTADGQIRPSF